MDDLPDYELHQNAGESLPPATPRPRSAGGLWIIVAALAVVMVAAGYIVFVWPPHHGVTPAATSESRAMARDLTLPSPRRTVEPIALPPLDASDTLVRTLVQALSESPAVVAWLPTKGLIRNFTVVVTNIAEGATPAKHLQGLRPTSSFSVLARGGFVTESEQSCQRYTWIADAVTSINHSAAATLYSTLKPRIEEAHRDLGSSAESFDQTLERAILALLAVPALDRATPLRPQGIGYAFADDELEALTAAQKQLLRMGPRNVRVIKAGLREIALALGIPPTHLPPG